MSQERLVIALGGNAISSASEGGSYNEQLRNIHRTMSAVADLIASEKYHCIITHGNGPQVGNLLIQQAAAKDLVPEMPMHVCGAMSQGQIGYLIQQNLRDILVHKGIRREVVTLITQVEVNKNDSSFKNSTKPVGPFYSEQEAKEKASGGDFIFREDAGRGWRRVVSSPAPVNILELEAIKMLYDKGVIVIASGGGGIPVTTNKKTRGIDAVIDKDHAAALLGDRLDADRLIILTAIDEVYLNFGRPGEKPVSRLTVTSASEYLGGGHFAEGSMKPKIEACIKFVRERQGRSALITSSEKLRQAMEGKNGTLIVYS